MTTELIAPGVATPISAPPNFPVAWLRPTDAQAFWTTDPLHYPKPIHQLEYAVVGRAVRGGFNSAAEALGLPIRSETRRINTYFYQSFAPPVLPPEQLAAMASRSQGLTEAALAQLGKRWRAEQLPEIERQLAFWRTFDLRGAALPVLLTHLDETLGRVERVWAIYFEVALPMLLAIGMFADLYADLFGAERAQEADRLLQGFDNKSLEADRELWRLSRAARATPHVREALTWCATHEVAPMLVLSEPGRAFLAELRAYLEVYGRRGDARAIIGAPSWIEDPAPVIKRLQEYVIQPDRDLAAELAALAAERERLLAEARERLSGRPQPAASQFELLLRAAQEAAALQQDLDFWIDQRCMYEVRLATQELGRRLADSGAIDDAGDVAYLTLEELRATAAALPRATRHALVIVRKSEMEHFSEIAPPPALGTLPAGAPEDTIGAARLLGVARPQRRSATAS